MKCPSCGADAYVGLRRIECPNPSCNHFAGGSSLPKIIFLQRRATYFVSCSEDFVVEFRSHSFYQPGGPRSAPLTLTVMASFDTRTYYVRPKKDAIFIVTMTSGLDTKTLTSDLECGAESTLQLVLV